MNMNEALSFFEMDTMLSVKERKPRSIYIVRIALIVSMLPHIHVHLMCRAST